MASNHGAGAQVDDVVDGYLDVIGRTEGQGIISFEPMLNPDVAPFDGRLSWNEDMNRLRAQFPFVQIDPPAIYLTKFAINAASANLAYNVIVPPNAQMYRVTYHASAVGVGLGISVGEATGDVTQGVFEGGLIVSPPPVWRYCRNSSTIYVCKVGPAAVGTITGSIEWFCQL